MKLDNKKIFQTLNPNKVWVPVLIGIGIVFARFYLDPNLTIDNLKVVFDASILWLVVAIVVLFFRARMRRPERQLVRGASRAHHFAVRKR